MKSMHMPRLMLAGIGGDCGKTLVTLGLATAWRRKGICIAPFKKGPDYIDPAWLGMASGRPARNLDTWMMTPGAARQSFIENAVRDGINIIEGNRGLYDGEDSAGTHSSAELSKLLKTPVILILPTVKITRTAAAIVLGMQTLDRDVPLAGVILNRVATARQEAVTRDAIEKYTGVPVLGAVRRVSGELLAGRHLGLVTPEEHRQSLQMIEKAGDLIAESVNLEKLRSIADNAPPVDAPSEEVQHASPQASGLRIGVFRSSAFTFYYPENLEALEKSGAILVSVDPLKDRELPDLDGLYIGGGFPETHASLLSANESFRASAAKAARGGLPIWAECGGLIFLCRSVRWQERQYPMAGVFPADVVLDRKPAGHGYMEVVVDRENPFLPAGTVLRGHEFHYSKLEHDGSIETAFRVRRGTGTGKGRDGLFYRNTVAGYLHVHALGAQQWVGGMLRAAAGFRKSR
jgi:cobyrinic acid a,c-diamide synthase